MNAPRVRFMKPVATNSQGTYGYVYRWWAKPFRFLIERHYS